jgi:hypothetical protein
MRLIAVTASLGCFSAYFTDPAPSHDREGLLQVLQDEGRLAVGQFVWEPSRGLLVDWFLGRPLLFEGSETGDPQAARDIYRALVRVSPEGRVLDLCGTYNLTRTRSADELDLGAQDNLAWFVTRGVESPASVTFVDLRGETRSAARASLIQRLQLGTSRLLETGTWSGLGRSDLFATEGPVSIQIGEKVEIHAGDRTATLSPSELFSADRDQGASTFGFVKRTREPVPWLHWAADTGRHFLGSGAIAWAEGRVFSLIDSLHQVSHSVHDTSPPETPPAPSAAPQDSKPASSTSETVPSFPPEPIVARNTRYPQDGMWQPVKSKVLPAAEPPLFYRTVLHPDPERPYAELHLVAMDMRRLKLGIGAGYEDPHPDTGPPGSGEIPESVAPTVVATFNGAFKALHGRYGMKAEGRLLVEPVVGAATVRIDNAESAGFGTWRAEHNARDVVALRQNLDPLVADGKPNPNKRKVWGDQLYGATVAVERSALCYHSTGHLLYGWATEATGETLAQGMAAAGCVYALHLDMNPGHCAFTFNKIESVKPLVAEGEALDPRMKINANRFVRWSPKDFFYLMMRSGSPKSDARVEWRQSPGEGPPPSAIPAIFSAEKRIGSLVIELDRVDTSRLRFHLLPGKSEPALGSSAESTDAETAALIAWGLGYRTHGTRAGLVLGGSTIIPLHGSYASLIVRDGRLQIEPPGTPPSPGSDIQIAQLPVLVREGRLLPAAHELGDSRRRSVLGIDNKGSLFVARMTHDTSAPLAQILVDLGCSLVVEMDRGSRSPPLVERAGTDAPPRLDPEQTTLYGSPAPLMPHSHLF